MYLGTPRNLRRLMALDLLTRRGWIDLATLATSLQVSEGEALPVVEELPGLTVAGSPVITAVDGVPDGMSEAWALAEGARKALDGGYGSRVPRRARASRESVALSYVRARRRISSTELGSLLSAHPTNMGRLLRSLEDQGLIEPSRPNRRGAGLYYLSTVGS